MASFMVHDPIIPTTNDHKLSHTGDPKSFGHQTARSRWGWLLNNAANEVLRIIGKIPSIPDDDVSAGRQLYKKIKDLNRDIQDNEELCPISDHDNPDVAEYNEELEKLNRPTWLNAPWLYAECYLYRVLHTYFTTSTPFWQTYDIFAAEKRHAFIISKKGTIELVKRFNEVLQAILENEIKGEATQRALMEEMIQISLWGNATDLSLLTFPSPKQLESRQGKASREASKKNLLVDDTAQVEKLLKSLKLKSSTSIHIVLDNAGFELLADLIFAGYLIESGYAKKIVLHGKCMPWFVSDVMERDLAYLINGLAEGTILPDVSPSDRQEITGAGKYWQGLQETRRLEFFAEPFWTTAHPYGRMSDVNPRLYEDLAGSDLVVYKGDLNYRKLTYDGQWPHHTPFEEALGPLARKVHGMGTRTLALRTAKADVAVGLSPGQEKALPVDWTRTGKYAMISYYDAKS